MQWQPFSKVRTQAQIPWKFAVELTFENAPSYPLCVYGMCLYVHGMCIYVYECVYTYMVCVCMYVYIHKHIHTRMRFFHVYRLSSARIMLWNCSPLNSPCIYGMCMYVYVMCIYVYVMCIYVYDMCHAMELLPVKLSLV